MTITYRSAEDLCNSARALILAGGLNRPDMDDLCTAYLALANLRDRLADDQMTNASPMASHSDHMPESYRHGDIKSPD